MPDLKNKLDKLLSEAAECQMIGSLAADAAKRAAYRERADQFRDLAEQVRTQISARPRRNIEFLLSRPESAASWLLNSTMLTSKPTC
ncbi:hypothetical protein [Bradyrhizobium sp. LHD-71]|uniref:hypothetical protein n=1 Tax=Bradyrhizobium sp. LHD-71 TaxID=3072141 RepID=UPI00280F92CB|nr:hypothetical protein [Bradyrhizobium sp. LHD-71]MDQ8730518.1 hypothetical protein [Bradyrhizobium sp. LHD-71]